MKKIKKNYKNNSYVMAELVTCILNDPRMV